MRFILLHVSLITFLLFIGCKKRVVRKNDNFKVITMSYKSNEIHINPVINSNGSTGLSVSSSDAQYNVVLRSEQYQVIINDRKLFRQVEQGDVVNMDFDEIWEKCYINCDFDFELSHINPVKIYLGANKEK